MVGSKSYQSNVDSENEARNSPNSVGFIDLFFDLLTDFKLNLRQISIFNEGTV